MPYLGNEAADRFVSQPAVDQFSGDGSTTAFTLSFPVTSDQDILVSVDGVIQDVAAYAVSSGTTLTFTAAPSSNSGNNIFVNYLARTHATVAHPATSALTATTGTFSDNVTISGNLSVSGTGAGAAGVVSASSSGTAISIDSSNRVTMPGQPAFMAGPATAQSNMANDTTIILGTEVFDVGSNFASNTFTAPVTGKYQLNASIRLQDVDSASSYIYLVIDTSNRDYYTVFSAPDQYVVGQGGGFDTPYLNLSVSVLADMDANDTAIMKFGYDGGAQQVDTSSSGGTLFSGALIC